MWIVSQQRFSLHTTKMKQLWGACKSTLQVHSPSRRHKDCHSMDETGRRHDKVAVGSMPPWHLPLPPALLSQNMQSWAEECRGSCPWLCLLWGCSCASKTPSTHWLQTAGPSCKVGSWLGLHLAPPLLVGKACKGDFYKVPEVCGKGKATQIY